MASCPMHLRCTAGGTPRCSTPKPTHGRAISAAASASTVGTRIYAGRVSGRSVPQGHRWELLRFHLSGLCTQQRLVSARRLPLAGPCHLCGGSVDSTTHLLQCLLTRQAESRLRTAARMPEGQLTVSEMFFQHARDGAEKAFGVALFAAVWFVRDRAWRRIGYVPPDVLTDSVVSAIQCP